MPDDLIVFFAYHFPPENVIGALRPFRFYKYLSRLGYRCHVITAADVSQLAGIQGEQVSDPFVTRARTGPGWQVERAIRKFLLPGVVGTQWSVHAYRAAARFIDQHPESRVTVFSTFPPVGVLFAGYWLSRQRNLPWVADFRDPLANNPIYNSINRFTKNVYQKLERIVMRSADVIVANTDAAQENFKTEYPEIAGRVELLWNGFDPEQRLLSLPVADPNRRVYAHVGELYGGRSATPILTSLRRLIDAGRLDAETFQVRLSGPVVPGSLPDADFIAQAEREGWLKLETDRVPQKAAHQIIRTADALLLIQWETASLQVPGKLYEYLQIGRPILAYVPRVSPVERILEKSGVPYRCVYTSLQAPEMDEAVLDFFQLRAPDTAPNAWFESEFGAPQQAAKLAEFIQRARRRHAGRNGSQAE